MGTGSVCRPGSAADALRSIGVLQADLRRRRFSAVQRVAVAASAALGALGACLFVLAALVRTDPRGVPAQGLLGLCALLGGQGVPLG